MEVFKAGAPACQALVLAAFAAAAAVAALSLSDHSWVMKWQGVWQQADARGVEARRLSAIEEAPPGITFEKKELEWLHIPKTGTSFGNTLLLWACPELAPRVYVKSSGVRRDAVPAQCRARFRDDPTARPCCFIGEHTSLTNRTDSQLGRVFAFVRSPASRLASGYHFMHGKGGMRASAAQMCAAADGVYRTRIHIARGVQARMIAGEKVEHRRGFGLPGGHHFVSRRPPSLAVADAACARLPRLAFVGITDFWAASVCLFHATFGGAEHEAELANVRRGGYTRRANTTRAADCCDEVDGRLFECALRLFLRRLEPHPHCAARLRPDTRFGSPGADGLLEAWLREHHDGVALQAAGAAGESGGGGPAS